MGINELSGSGYRRVVGTTDGTTIVYEDRNQDKKEELFSIERYEGPTYDNCTHKATYYDFDGDGYCDLRNDLITPNYKGKDGKVIPPWTTSTVYDTKDGEKPKMDEILNPKPVNLDTWW